MHILSNLKSTQDTHNRRTDPFCPKWFTEPFESLGYTVHLAAGRELKVWREHFGKSIYILVFNPSVVMFFLTLISPKKRNIFLYQHSNLETRPFYKRLIFKIMLSRSSTVLVYSKVTQIYLRDRLKIESTLYPLYTDIDFWKASAGSVTKNRRVVVPGDHRRDEGLLRELVNLGYEVIRITRDKVLYESLKNTCEGLKLVFNISYLELRDFYVSAKYVLILSDSREIPAGITSLCEALSCNSTVVVTEGLSNVEFDGVRPYVVVPRDIDAVSLHELLSEGFSINSRHFAETYLSLNPCREILKKHGF